MSDSGREQGRHAAGLFAGHIFRIASKLHPVLRIFPTWDELRPNAWWATIAFMIAGGFAQYKASPPWVQALLYLLAVLGATLASIAFFIIRGRRRRNAQPTTPTDSSAPVTSPKLEPAVNTGFSARAETVEQLRTLHASFAKAAWLAADLVEADLSDSSIQSDPRLRLILTLVRAFPLAQFRHEATTLDQLMSCSTQMLASNPAALSRAFNTAVSSYTLLLHHIEEAASVVYAGGITAAPWYPRLRALHRAFADKLTDLKHREDFGAMYSEIPELLGLLAAEPKPAQALRVQTRIEGLADALEARHETRDLLTAGLLGRRFLVLEVTNVGPVDLTHVVATAAFSGSASEGEPRWSKDSGRSFTPGGSHAADIYVADYRCIVVAQAIADSRLWARLTEPLFDIPVRANAGAGGESFTSRSGENITLGRDVHVSIRFRSQQIDETIALRLTFNEKEPRAEPMP